MTVRKAPKVPARVLARIIEIKDAMASAGPMTINDIPGRWNAEGDMWIADDLTGCDTIALARISEAEEEEINGVARQVEDISTLCARSRFRARIGMVLIENDTSAFKRRRVELPNGGFELRTIRPKFSKAIKLLAERRFRKFAVYHLDRVVRDPRDLEDLIDVVENTKPRPRVLSVTGSINLDSDSGITAARVGVAFANQSSRDGQRRVARTRRQQAEEGRCGGGGRRFGFEPDGITKRPHEAAVIKKYTDLALTDASLKEIARDMRAAGVVGVSGKPFTAEGARDMLMRPRNAGLCVYRPGRDYTADFAFCDEEEDEQPQAEPDPEQYRRRRPYTREEVVGRLEGEPIVEEDVYWRLVAKITDPERRTNGGAGAAPKYLGSCLFRCVCGAILTVQNKKRQHTDRRTGERTHFYERIYRCSEPTKGVKHVTVAMAELDALIIATIVDRIRMSDPADIIGKPTNPDLDVTALRAELTEHHTRLLEIAADREEDLITRAQFLAQTSARRAKIDAVTAKLATAAEEAHPAAKLVGVADINTAWKDLTLTEQRAIVRRMLLVTVLPLGNGNRAPAHERTLIDRPITRRDQVRIAA
ncbi:recombinase family protein [Nonomuraea endophytica]|uniref:recombinase family protein n=1 Tax=Nonomuraea endophytica TaxID=714136 RepID=UPI0037CAB60D